MLAGQHYALAVAVAAVLTAAAVYANLMSSPARHRLADRSLLPDCKPAHTEVM